jgi:cadmium resistance protein CadD (predicted permease)
LRVSLKLLFVAIILFASTNLDDIFVLVGFFANPRFRAENIVVGQYLGLGFLFGVSIVGVLLTLVLPHAYLGFFGIIPIAIGVKTLFERCKVPQNAYKSETHPLSRPHSQVASVALVTVANGADNLGVYLPEFAIRSRIEIGVCAVVFALMTALWCFIAHWLVHHPTVGKPIRRYGAIATPLILIGIGFSIMYEGGSFGLVVNGGH